MKKNNCYFIILKGHVLCILFCFNIIEQIKIKRFVFFMLVKNGGGVDFPASFHFRFILDQIKIYRFVYFIPVKRGGDRLSNLVSFPFQPRSNQDLRFCCLHAS